jgi:8-oxo-dGTP pyrophosphatase MutT (NUDIX family)
LLDRARAYAAGEVDDVAAPRDAATIALLRDGADGLEVYLLRRVGSMAFAAGMHVFPGGTVDPRDADAGLPWAGPDDDAWGRALVADPPSARALVCAAVRETFEESGVLLAGLSPDEVVADTTGADWESEREALVDRTLSFADLVRRRGLVVRSDLLRAWSHWVTPEFEPRRYDTRFFVAALPAGQRTRDVGGEADRVAWVPARLAVQRYAAGEMAMLPPTAATLRELAAHDRVADALAAVRVIAPITPRPVVEGGDVQLVVDVGGRTVPADQATGDVFR